MAHAIPLLLPPAVLLAALLPHPARATMPTARGDVAPEVRHAAEAGLFALPAPVRLPNRTQRAPIQAEWNVPVVMIAYSDEPLLHSSASFDTALFDTTGSTPTGSVYDYYQWVSGGLVRVRGRVVARVQLQERRAYYGANAYGLAFSATPNNIFGALKEALDACTDDVDWEPFDQDRDGYVDVLWLVHAGRAGEMSFDRNDFWSITSRMSAGWRQGGPFITRQLVPGSSIVFRIDRFSTMPEQSIFQPGGRSEIGVFCHEFGHALGLPDLYDTSTLGSAANVGPGNWSLMSTGGYGGNGLSPEAPTHIGGWGSVMLGWRDVVRPTRDTTITLTPLHENGPVIEFWHEGLAHPEHFLLECRDRDGFDRTLNNGGLIITHVDEAVIGSALGSNRVNAGLSPGLWLVEADADSDLVVGRNRGDAYDPFPGLGAIRAFDETTRPAALTFEGGSPGIAIRNIQRIGSDVRFDLQVRPPGWLPAEDRTRGAYQPLGSLGLGVTGVQDGNGDLHRVQSEMVEGRSQVVLRSRAGGVWQEPVVLSQSPVGAVDPCVARLGRGDLLAAWSDLSGGRSRIVFRARVRGQWSPERIVGNLPGDNRAPALGADAQGRVHLAWSNLVNDEPYVAFTRFLYFAPGSLPMRLTPAGNQPGPPTIAVSPGGTSHVIWSERKTSPWRLYFSRFHPDTGSTNPLPITPSPPGSQTPVTAHADSAGTLHVAWIATNYGAYQIHYQRRPHALPMSPRDTVIESRATTMGELALASDPAGTLHLAYVSAPDGPPQVFYKRWRPIFGWDVSPTEVTSPADAALHPSLTATRPGTVSVLYTAAANGARLLERLRQIEPPLPALDAAPQRAPVADRLDLGPNPLPAGTACAISWSGEGVAADLFDLSGRRVASAPARPHGAFRVARFRPEDTRRLAAGVYFVRPRGWNGAGARLVVLH